VAFPQALGRGNRGGLSDRMLRVTLAHRRCANHPRATSALAVVDLIPVIDAMQTMIARLKHSPTSCSGDAITPNSFAQLPASGATR
jgi:hypothetical protein